MHAFFSISAIAALPLLLTPAASLGINCRGFGLCPRAGWNDRSSESIVHVLRDAIWTNSDDNSTTFGNGDHIICVSQNQPVSIEAGVEAGAEEALLSLDRSLLVEALVSVLFLSNANSLDAHQPLPSLSRQDQRSVLTRFFAGEGGICVFLQNMADGARLDLGTIRPLTDSLLEHGCSVCGSVPIHEVDQQSNDPSDGILTFNYVANPFCDGGCMSASGGAPATGSKSRVRRAETLAKEFKA